VKAFEEYEYEFLPNADGLETIFQEFGAELSIVPYASGDADEDADKVKEQQV
jgi:division protein CdvB (Snf7/Vps24/ESCRT-III family)